MLSSINQLAIESVVSPDAYTTTNNRPGVVSLFNRRSAPLKAEHYSTTELAG